MKLFLVLVLMIICNQSGAQILNIKLEHKIGYNPYDRRSYLSDPVRDSTAYSFDKRYVTKYLIKRFTLIGDDKIKTKLLYDYMDLLITKTKDGDFSVFFDQNRDRNFIDEKKIIYKRQELSNNSPLYFKLLFPFKIANGRRNLTKIVKPNLIKGGLKLGTDIENELFISLDEYSYWKGSIINEKKYFDVIIDDNYFLELPNNIKVSFNKKDDKHYTNIQAVSIGDTLLLFRDFFIFKSINRKDEKLSIDIRLVKNIHPIGSNIGFVAPKFILSNTKGVEISLSKFNGKYILIDFWASWCMPCRAEHPSLKEIYKNYKSYNFTIVSISLDDDKKQWMKAIEKDKIGIWNHLISEKAWDSKIVKSFSINSIPYNFLIAPDGIIAGKNLKYSDLVKILKNINSKPYTKRSVDSKL